MLKVSINGKITHVPECTCGKCIVRRKLQKLDPSLPYHNIRSIYTSDYPPKKGIKILVFIIVVNIMVSKIHIKEKFQIFINQQ